MTANSYDAIMLLSSCVESCGKTKEAVRKCLAQTKDYVGVGGVFSIDAKGDAVRKLVIKTIKNGQFVYYQELLNGD